MRKSHQNERYSEAGVKNYKTFSEWSFWNDVTITCRKQTQEKGKQCNSCRGKVKGALILVTKAPSKQRPHSELSQHSEHKQIWTFLCGLFSELGQLQLGMNSFHNFWLKLFSYMLYNRCDIIKVWFLKGSLPEQYSIELKFLSIDLAKILFLIWWTFTYCWYYTRCKHATPK